MKPSVYLAHHECNESARDSIAKAIDGVKPGDGHKFLMLTSDTDSMAEIIETALKFHTLIY